MLDHLWGIPVLTRQFRDTSALNERLATIILAKEAYFQRHVEPREIAGIKDGLSSRWYSYNVLAWRYAECRRLRGMVQEVVRSYITRLGHESRPMYLQCWANVLRKGERLALHSHVGPHSYISGVYWVRSQGTATVYRCPLDTRIVGVEDFLEVERTVRSREGKMVIFPSFIEHQTTPVQGDTCRISVAFDVTFQPPPPLHNGMGRKVHLPFEA